MPIETRQDVERRVTVVIRSAAERTVELCRSLLLEQLPDEHLHCIQESPFSRAVTRTFELGLEANLPWTAAVDADVLVRPHALTQLIDAAEQAGPDVFEAQSDFFDKLFQGPRSGGIHLYRTSMLDQALEFARREEVTHRPEFHVIQKMVGAGYRQQLFDFLIGIHDFDQYLRDYYRKGFVHAQKHAIVLDFLEPMWRRLAESDSEFKATLIGMAAGREAGGIAKTDIRAFDESVTAQLAEHGLEEKQAIQESEHGLVDIDRRLAAMETAPEFSEWQRHQQQALNPHWRIRCRMALGKTFAKFPAPIQKAVRTVLRRPATLGDREGAE